MGRIEPGTQAVMDEALAQRLAALKTRFRERALGEAQALAQLSETLDGPPELELQAQIRRIAHSLSGGGGTFGYDVISASAAKLEELVLDHPDAPELAATCRALVADVRRVLEQDR